MLNQILHILSSALEPRIDLLVDMTRKVYKSNVQSTQSLEKMGSEVPPLDIKHTWLQDPVRLEDPFGRYIPIPSEYSFSMMEAVVIDRYKADPNARRIQLKQFEIFNPRNSDQAITEEQSTGFIPGMQLRMAVILYKINAQTDRCPIPTCGSSNLSKCCTRETIWSVSLP